MGNLLKKIGNTLAPIVFIIVVLINFIGFTNKSITSNEINKLNEQIEYNETHKKPALTVDGVKADGTKMTDEEYQVYLDEQAKVVDIDIITPVIIEQVNKINISINNSIIISIILGIILSLFGIGLFKCTSKVSGGIFISSLLSIGITFNLSRYINIGDITSICKEHIIFLVICAIIYIISKIGNNIKNKIVFKKEEKEVEKKIKSRIKQTQDLEDEILNVNINSNEPIFVVATREDSTVTTVKERKINDSNKHNENIDELKELAFNDNLTKLYNQTAFLKDIETTKIENASIIILDINNLKEINETYGYTKGNDLIIYTADYIKFIFEKFGKCYRLEGNKFAVLLKDIKDEEKIKQTIEKLNSMLEKNNTLPFSFIVASGFAIFDKEKDKNLNNTFDRATKSMYENKKAIKLNKNIKNKDINETKKEIQDETITENTELETVEEKVEQTEEIIDNIQEIEENEDTEEVVVEDIVPIEENKETKKSTKKEEVVKEEILDIPTTNMPSKDNTLETTQKEEIVVQKENNKPISNYDEDDEDFSIKISEDLKNNDYYKETYIERIDGTIEKINNETNDTDYDAIRRYLDSKKKEEEKVFIKEEKINPNASTEDLPFANYNPDIDSPYKFENTTTILDKEMEKVEIEKTDNIEEDDS